ncbi:MAG: winged helix-turn-helix domain-containing protein [Pseudomonadota bacterium]
MRDPFRLGAWFVDPVSRDVTDGSVQATLSPRAIGVLATLCKAGTRTVERDALLDAVWPDVTASDESLTQAVAELRRAFRSGARDRDIVATVPKTGYRLLVEPMPCDCASVSVDTAQLDHSLDAYCLVLEAHAAMIRADHDALEQAIELSREAVARSPAFAMAQAAHSVILSHNALYGGGGRRDLEAALGYAEAAVDAGPSASASFAARGFALGALGRYDDAFAAFTKCMALNDRDGEGHYLAARTAIAAGDRRMAVALALRCAELVDDTPRPLFLAARAARHVDLALSRRIARRCTRDLYERLAVDPDEPRSRYTLGPALSLCGDVDGALETMISKPEGVTICAIHDAFGFAVSHDESRALDALEDAMDEGYRDGRWLLHEPMLASLHDNARFRRITRTLQAA